MRLDFSRKEGGVERIITNTHCWTRRRAWAVGVSSQLLNSLKFFLHPHPIATPKINGARIPQFVLQYNSTYIARIWITAIGGLTGIHRQLNRSSSSTLPKDGRLWIVSTRPVPGEWNRARLHYAINAVNIMPRSGGPFRSLGQSRLSPSCRECVGGQMHSTLY